MGRMALVVVDVQRDFCPGGSLGINHGDSIIPRLNRVIEAFQRAKLPIFFTRDWHPPDHCSFRAQGGIWPPHCVMGTDGAGFHSDLEVPPGSVVINKASDPSLEAYSTFQGTDLERQLRERHIHEIVLGGLATDYCVKESSLDALRAGFGVSVLKDCVKGVNLRRNDSALAIRAIATRGARLISSEEAIRKSRRAAILSSS